ncbi:MAG: LytR/AlgR family response regulator transcription factor [Saprospiraceae bacterium]
MQVSTNSCRLLLKNGTYYYPVKTEDIIYLVADGAYTIIQLKSQKISVSKSLKTITPKLDAKTFCRIHHSTVININHITRFSKIDDNTVEMSNGKQLPISTTRKKEFYNSFKTI